MEKIKTVTIEKNWTATSINRGEEDCNQRPAITPDDVKRFLQEAGRITEHDAVLGDLSSCIASGRLVTESGRHAEWEIGQGGADSDLTWEDTGEVVHLYY